jgi:mRNA-binding protein PUF3
VDQQAELVKELKADILKCVKDQNGNHVVQKAVERVPIEHIRFIIEIFRGQTHVLAVHTYGCRVIQRILEFCKPQDQAFILEELHACTAPLIPDQYGNYVVQHIIEKGRPDDRAKAIKVVQGQLLQFCKHKYASNVVESAIAFGTPEQRNAILAQLLAPINENATNNLPKTHLAIMMADQYANYVVRKSCIPPLSLAFGTNLYQKPFWKSSKVMNSSLSKKQPRFSMLPRRNGIITSKL